MPFKSGTVSDSDDLDSNDDMNDLAYLQNQAKLA